MVDDDNLLEWEVLIIGYVLPKPALNPGLPSACTRVRVMCLGTRVKSSSRLQGEWRKRACLVTCAQQMTFAALP